MAFLLSGNVSRFLDHAEATHDASQNISQVADRPRCRSQYSATVVTGFWRIPSKTSLATYVDWFKSSLVINAPYVVHYEEAWAKATVSAARQGLPTNFVLRPLSAFATAATYRSSWTHDEHLPSRQLGLVWLEKVAMVAEVARANPFGTSWFAWVDAGAAAYRHVPPPAQPWPDRRRVATLPTDRIIYTGTEEFYHDFAGTAFLVHGGISAEVHRRFYAEVDRCAAAVDDWRCGNDQYLMTKLKTKHPDFFYRIGEGYGDVVRELYMFYRDDDYGDEETGQ
jgi:hypothetical protein